MKWLHTLALAGWLLSGFATLNLYAGGSGLNVVIIVNQASSNSVQLGNYYQEQRQVPAENFLRINWTGGNVQWTTTDFTNALLNPFRAMLSSRQLTNQVDYVVLSMDIPYRVYEPGQGDNATTGALFYGFKPDPNPPCSLAENSTSAYASSEAIFRNVPPLATPGSYFLATMLTGNTLGQAKQIVDQGVRSDATFPSQTVVLGKGSDWIRNLRFFAFDNTVFNTRLRGNYSMLRTNVEEPVDVTNLLGYENGAAIFRISSNTFVPGAMADSLTSFAGQVFEASGQTSEFAFLNAGAAGSYGTVTEPCNYPQKFPDPQNYFFQARGFSLAECYYQSLTNPYQGLIIGEPLAAPFARSGAGTWTGLPANTLLSGITNLALQFSALDARHPLQQVDLFVDGHWQQSLTNLIPSAGNVLTVSLAGQSTQYTVPPLATLAAITAGLATNLNNLAPVTGVSALAHGDRIELQATNGISSGAQVSVSVATAAGSGPLTTFVESNRTNFLDSIAWGLQGCTVGRTLSTNSYLQITVTKTNGSVVTLAATNSPGNTDLPTFINQFGNVLNSSVALQGLDGLVLEDVQPFDYVGTQYFDLRARAIGYAAARIKTVLHGSANLLIFPSGTNALMDNLSDLAPRHHLYVSTGVTNLAFTSPLNTAALPDGYHELSAVAYEGTHVHTQTRATQTVLVRNTPLSATFSSLVGGTNTALEATLQFAVAANSGAISRMELFSTGGLLAAVTNQSSTVFSVATTNLDLGLHPFHALITAANGQQYRTPTIWFRLVGLDRPFTLQFTAPPPTLAWPAAAGRRYDILQATAANGTYSLRTTITPTNSLGQWRETGPASPPAFYRVRVSP